MQLNSIKLSPETLKGILCRPRIDLLDLRNMDGSPILQPFRHFTYVTTHSPTLPSLYPRHSSFSNPSAASPTSQLM